MFFHFFTLCSAHVSALVIALCDSLCEELEILGDLSHIERGQIVGERLAGAPVTETATLLGVSRVTASKVMSAYLIHEKKTSAKRNTARK
jgi:hypothetical protein